MSAHHTDGIPVSGPPPRRWAAIVIAVSATVLGVLPAFLIGTLAVEIRAELVFGEAALGALITIYMLISAMLSPFVGRVVERVGASAGLRMATGTGAISMLGIGLVADSYGALALLFLIGGLGHAAVHPASNLALARRVPPDRQGLAFGIKHAAIPGASFLGGMAVPVSATALGWRGVFVIVGLVSLAVVLAAGTASTERKPRSSGARVTPVRLAPLLVLACGVALAVGAVQPLPIFYVTFAAQQGMSPSLAGVLLAIASVLNILIRIVSGGMAGHRGPGSLLAISTGFIVIGALGPWLLALSPGLWAVGVGIVLGISIGWSWNAMFQYSVVKANQEAPAAASSITQAGLLVGAAIGPLLFGAAAEWSSFAHAWAGVGFAMLAGAGLVLLASRMFARHEAVDAKTSSASASDGGPAST